MAEDTVPPIDWMEVLETGVSEIDDAHRALIGQCNALGETINRGAWPDVVEGARRLADYCSQHFRTEEVLLDKTEFPRSDRHKLQHRELERRFNELIGFLAGADGSNPEDRKVAGKVRATLVDILFRHDLDFKSHLQHIAGH